MRASAPVQSDNRNNGAELYSVVLGLAHFGTLSGGGGTSDETRCGEGKGNAGGLLCDTVECALNLFTTQSTKTQTTVNQCCTLTMLVQYSTVQYSTYGHGCAVVGNTSARASFYCARSGSASSHVGPMSEKVSNVLEHRLHHLFWNDHHRHHRQRHCRHRTRFNHNSYCVVLD